jgi:REP element-mobilizing transposase RayT
VWSFRKPINEKRIGFILKKFSTKYAVRIISMANVGNHLHFQIKLQNRFTYKPFIRAITGSIAQAVTGKTRWSESVDLGTWKDRPKLKFWDYRPYTRVIHGFKALLNLRDYIAINRLEGAGYSKMEATFLYFLKQPINSS